MFDFAAYAASLRAPIRNLVHVSRAMRMLHLHGTAAIEFELDPSGRLVFARIDKSSGSGLIDRSALDAVERMRYPSFPGTGSKVFILPITISPDTGDG